MQLTLTNTRTRAKEVFTPIDAQHITMYVCGPTVYARPHIGNARSVVVYDVLFRLLSYLYPRVTYARNITDVDDKINAAAVSRNISIQALTEEVTTQFHADMDALGALRPTIEPRATMHIAQMIAMIETLIARGHAYEAEGHVLFSVSDDEGYGSLSRRSRDDMIAGARVEVAPYKKDPADFVLWKPVASAPPLSPPQAGGMKGGESKPARVDDPSSVFDSPWGVGRPGWHIECSAMARAHLGASFDIHGGGADLMFPHHENEVAQARCAHPEAGYARYWVHNGFLTAEGEKMSKSLGNFVTVNDLLMRGIKGEAIRFALLSTRYNEPLDWTEKLLADANKVMDRLYRRVASHQSPVTSEEDEDGASLACCAGGVHSHAPYPDAAVVEALCDDLNTPKAIALLQAIEDVEVLKSTANFMGLLLHDPRAWFQGAGDEAADIEAQIEARKAAKAQKDWAAADAIRNALKEKGIILEDKPDGTVIWRKG